MTRHPKMHAALMAAATTALWAGGARAETPGADACAALTGHETEALTITGATLLEESSAAPEACEVMASLPQPNEASDIRIRVVLPTEWSGRSVQFGGGGFNGTIPAQDGARWQTPEAKAAFPFKRHVTFSGDSGHQAESLPHGPDVDPRKASFALNKTELRNYGGESVGKTWEGAMEIVQAYYGQAPEFSYFVGFSQGGKEAMVAAQRYADHYDGILAGDPVVGLSGLMMQHQKATNAFYRDGGAGWIPPETAELVSREIYAQCDGIDGLEDGWIADYAGCQPDLSVMLCKDGASEGCLSEAQLTAVNRLHAPLELEYPLANGVTRHAGYPWGNVAWGGSFLGTRPAPGTPFQIGLDAYVHGLADGYVRFFVMQDPAFDTVQFDANDPAVRDRIQQVAEIIDASDPNLTPLADHGAKLILYAGGASEVPPEQVAAYWTRMSEATEAETGDFARFYTFPSINHSGTGPEGMPAASDLFSALEAWVETDAAPGTLINSSPTGDPEGAERPLCQYPTYPRYDGNGDPMRAESFSCVE